MEKSRELHLRSAIEKEKLEVFRFKWEEILPETAKKCKHARWQSRETQKKLKKNGEAFIHWVVNLLSLYVSTPPKGKKWNSPAVYMNEKNVNYLESQIDSWLWLNIAPTCCQELGDDEYGVDPTAVLTDTP